jgi:propanol-preferring alcohol dehydrogenase
MVMTGGRVVVIGEHDQPCSASSTQIAQRELEIIGSRNGTRQDLLEAIRLVERGMVRPLIAARFPLIEINQAMLRARQGLAGRVVVRINN